MINLKVWRILNIILYYLEDNLSPKPPKYKKKKSKKKSSKNSPNRRLKRRVNNMPQNIKHEAPSTSRSEAKLKSIEKLIIGENQRHQRKSRNSSIREGFYSHSPQTDKISNILVKNCMKTHRQSKQGSQNIWEHLYNISYWLLEKKVIF